MALTLSRPRLLDMSSYQWSVLFAAWLGWGFDVFDGLLFNFVAPNCIHALTHTKDPHRIAWWNAIGTSVLLVGWAVGGTLFGRVADKLGRTRTLMLTMLVYALGTALCAVAPNIWFLLLFRIVASLGIGGEWAAGASMVAEVVPERRRVEAGALLYTSAPAGYFLAAFLNKIVAGEILKAHPDSSWRVVFLLGLIPAACAFLVRTWIKEPERWEKNRAPVKLSELFSAKYRRNTLSGFIPALITLITWWTFNSFLQLGSSLMAGEFAMRHHYDAQATTVLKADWVTIASYAFNWGGLLGTLLTIPAATYLGRRAMYGVYFAVGAVAILVAFSHDWPVRTLLAFVFVIGVSIFGAFGSFTFYLPELFPTRLRATGAGFCYNTGRLVTAAGPLLIAQAVSHGKVATHALMHAMMFVGLVPLAGLCLLPLLIETKGRDLAD